jgi:hypothetical protein
MACDCTAFTAREIGFPRSVGFLRGGMVRVRYKTVVNTPTIRAARLGKRMQNSFFDFATPFHTLNDTNPKYVHWKIQKRRNL